MNRRLFSVIFIIIFAALLCGVSFADSSPDFGGFEAGSSMKQLITGSDGAVSVALYDENGDGSPDSVLPSGIEILKETDENGAAGYYLSGTPSVSGHYSFTLKAVMQSADEAGEGEVYELIYCSMSVTTPAPSVSISEDISCDRGDTAVITVTASPKDGGILSYQWYSNTVNSEDGAVIIPGADSPVYTVPTSNFMDGYYFCVVTDTNNGQSASANTSTVHVTVKGVEKLEITSAANKTSYTEGDRLDTSGLEVTAVYSDGAREKISASELGFYPLMFESSGSQTVKISYSGASCSYNVNVAKYEDKVELIQAPSKTDYYVGDSLDVSGLKLKITTRAGSEEIDGSDSKIVCSPTKMTFAGSQTITVIYNNGPSVTFTVKVSKEAKISGISIYSLPAAQEYTCGDRLNTTGLSLSVKYDDGSTKTVTEGFTCSPVLLSDPADRQVITVTYESFTATFTVEVKEASAAPAATEAPASGTTEPVTPTLKPSSTETKKSGGSAKTLLVIIAAVIGIAALAGAGAYIMILKKQNEASDAQEEVKKSAHSEPAPEDPIFGDMPLDEETKDYFAGLFDDDELKK